MRDFLSLCYHYIRPDQERNFHPQLLGNTESEFREHLDMLGKRFTFISEGTITHNRNKTGMLITFDDGLSDHYRAAKILHEYYDIKAIFFIPTCILEGEPANPNIIHYGLYLEKIAGFLDIYHQTLADLNLDTKENRITFIEDETAVWQVIPAIKKQFKYTFNMQTAREVLLHIFNTYLLPKYPDLFSTMHLTKEQMSEMLAMGHSLGVHTHSHISVAWHDLDDETIKKEIIAPKDLLEKQFQTTINSFSYPFGEAQDCLETAHFLEKTHSFTYAFTVEPIVNDEDTSLLELGRYMPMSTDTTPKLKQKMDQIISQHSSQ